MKLTQQFKNDFESFLMKLFIIIWFSSICISIGGISLKLYYDFNFYKLFVMMMIGFAITIVALLIISIILIIVIGAINSFKQFIKYAFEK